MKLTADRRAAALVAMGNQVAAVKPGDDRIALTIEGRADGRMIAGVAVGLGLAPATGSIVIATVSVAELNALAPP